jgi:hypothetical protein
LLHNPLITVVLSVRGARKVLCPNEDFGGYRELLHVLLELGSSTGDSGRKGDAGIALQPESGAAAGKLARGFPPSTRMMIHCGTC